MYCEYIDIDVRHGDDQKPSTKKSIIKFTESLELSGQRPTILPLLVKSYHLTELSKEKITKQIALNKAQESRKSGIMEEKLIKIDKKGDEVQTNLLSMLYILLKM